MFEDRLGNRREARHEEEDKDGEDVRVKIVSSSEDGTRKGKCTNWMVVWYNHEENVEVKSGENRKETAAFNKLFPLKRKSK